MLCVKTRTNSTTATFWDLSRKREKDTVIHGSSSRGDLPPPNEGGEVKGVQLPSPEIGKADHEWNKKRVTNDVSSDSSDERR